MLSNSLRLGILLVASTALADPLRSGEDWAIYALATPADWQSLVQSENLAVGKRVQAEPVPNDPLTTSDHDAHDLTDGQFGERSDEKIWFEKGAVGWQGTPLNDGLFAFDNFDNTYPELLQMAMPSLYVARNQRAVAQGVAANRSGMNTNDIIPWLTTGCYGDYDPRHTRDMVLEAPANGSRGVTYCWYGHFDAAHFKYHAEAVDIAAPVEDIFMDGQPLSGLQCSHKQVKLCGMGLSGRLAVLVSNYDGLAPETQVTVRVPAAAGTPVWDLHSGRRIDQTGPDGFFAISLGHTAAHLLLRGAVR